MFTATPARKTRGAKHVPAAGSEPLEGPYPTPASRRRTRLPVGGQDPAYLPQIR